MAASLYKQAKRLTDTSQQMISQARELIDRSRDASLSDEEQQRLRLEADKLLDRSIEINQVVRSFAR